MKIEEMNVLWYGVIFLLAIFAVFAWKANKAEMGEIHGIEKDKSETEAEEPQDELSYKEPKRGKVKTALLLLLIVFLIYTLYSGLKLNYTLDTALKAHLQSADAVEELRQGKLDMSYPQNVKLKSIAQIDDSKEEYTVRFEYDDDGFEKQMDYIVKLELNKIDNNYRLRELKGIRINSNGEIIYGSDWRYYRDSCFNWKYTKGWF